MRARAPLLAVLLLGPALAGCTGGPADDQDPGPRCVDEGLPDRFASLESPDALHLQMNTSEGDIVAELHHERAPVTVANFVRYASEGFYDETVFHRVVEDFVIQGGGFDANFTKKDTRTPIPLERHPDLENTRGTLSMARTQRPDTATSQFFVNLVDNTDTLGRGAGYAVFGEVVEGMDAVAAIGAVETGQREGRQNVPQEDVHLHCTSLSLPDSDGDPPVRAAAVLGEARPPTNGTATVPFQVVNDWDQRRDVQVGAAGDVTDVTVPRDAGLTLSPGATALVLAEVPVDAGEVTAGIQVTADGTADEATTPVRPTEGTGPAADETNNTRVDVRYVGLLRSGVPFDTNLPTVDEREGLRILPDQGGASQPFKVWTGDGEDPDGEYNSVIPGFSDALLGLREDQTRLRKVPPDQGYQDGVTRWFHVAVEGVSSG